SAATSRSPSSTQTSRVAALTRGKGPAMTKHGFAERYHVKLESELIEARPDKLMDDMPRGSAHWKCVLRCGPRRMTFYYSQGPAVVGEPKIACVLDNLASDAAGFENAPTFQEWAPEYGYDADSRKAERIYNAVERQAGQLRALLGQDAYKQLLWHTD